MDDGVETSLINFGLQTIEDEVPRKTQNELVNTWISYGNRPSFELSIYITDRY